jgi:Leucine-rich repeat (LRR) protein
MLKKKIFLLLLAFILIFVFTSCTDKTVDIPDPSLQHVIRNALNKPTGNITTDDMLKLTELDAGSKSISDLKGLEFAKNLTNLNLSSNKIKNIASLSNLTKLKVLNLSNNQIHDISPLKDLINLQKLDLSNNQINDVSALYGLSNLSILNLAGNIISDTSQLINLTNLKEVNLEGYDMSYDELKQLEEMKIGTNTQTDVQDEIQPDTQIDVQDNTQTNTNVGMATDLGAGNFTAGRDIKIGVYDVTASEGQGNFVITTNDGNLITNEILGNNADIGVNKVRVILSDGWHIQISGLNKVHFEPVSSNYIPNKQQITLYSGYWLVGSDIAPGRYIAGNNVSSSSNFIVYDNSGEVKVNEIISSSSDIGVKQVTIDLNKGDIINISDSNGITLFPQ